MPAQLATTWILLRGAAPALRQGALHPQKHFSRPFRSIGSTANQTRHICMRARAAASILTKLRCPASAYPHNTRAHGDDASCKLGPPFQPLMNQWHQGFHTTTQQPWCRPCALMHRTVVRQNCSCNVPTQDFLFTVSGQRLVTKAHPQQHDGSAPC